MNTCIHCGKEVSDKSNFCPFCGTQLREIPAWIKALRTEEERLTPMQVTTKVYMKSSANTVPMRLCARKRAQKKP